MATCSCPAPTELPDIPSWDGCPVNIGQIQKLAFRRFSTGSIFDGVANPIADEASWTAFKAAADDTKIVTTPTVYNAEIAAGEAITNGGGDNTTLNGAIEINGTNAATFTGEFRSLPQTIIAEIKKLGCEGLLTVYFFQQDGKAVASLDESVTPGSYRGFELLGEPFFGSLNNSGFATRDTNQIQFSLKPDYSDALAVVDLNFNPLSPTF